jgi:replication factor A1
MPLVKIRDIQPEMRNIELTGRVTKVSDKREVETKFGPASVAAAILEDETASIRLNLWRWQIDSVKEGDTVKIINGFTRTFEGRIELNIGGDGKIIVLSRTSQIER